MISGSSLGARGETENDETLVAFRYYNAFNVHHLHYFYYFCYSFLLLSHFVSSFVIFILTVKLWMFLRTLRRFKYACSWSDCVQQCHKYHCVHGCSSAYGILCNRIYVQRTYTYVYGNECAHTLIQYAH